MGLDRNLRLAHLAENLLERARAGEIKIQGIYADLSLRSCDALRTMIEGLQGIKPGGELIIPENFDDLIRQLDNPEGCRIGEQLDKAATAGELGKARRTQKIIHRVTQAESTIHVGTGRLDSLINMVGELVIAQSMVTQDPNVLSGDKPRLTKNVVHAGKIIRDLQDLSMSLRMVPLKGTFQKMARLVRDLARKAGKNVRFVTEGEETEIDRNMVEALNDPLIHMIRNSVDHGIESADERANTDKNKTGTIRLRAYHAAGNVIIELIDDGKGLDRQKILAKAIDQGLVEAGRELSDSEIFALIFQPGLSTSERITDVSGRGVGMDVVKRGIESIRGRIDVSSRPGHGSTFAMRMPLTMAITDAMLLRVGNERFLLPTVSIEHSFKPVAGAVSTVTNQGEMVMLRGDLVPLFRLHELFNISDAIHDPYQALSIIIESNGRRCALMVDELLGQQQVVVKSLGQFVGQIPGVEGAGILGDGRVGLILDASGMIKLTLDGDDASVEAA